MTDYPWPSDLVPFAQSFYLQPHTGGSESPFTHQTKVYGLSKPRWVTSITLRAPDSADRWNGSVAEWGERVDAFLAQLDGRLNRVQLWDFRRPGRAPTFTSSAITAGDPHMILGGATLDSIRPGEYVGGDGRPHIITNVTSITGGVLIDVRPYFEATIATGDAIFQNVPGFFRLTSDDAGSNPSQVGELTQYQLDFVEDFGPSVDVTFGSNVVTYTT